MHPIWEVIKENPNGTLVIALLILLLVHSLIKAFINRNKPSCSCYCNESVDEDGNDD